jgi:hypothetical protein
MSDSHRFKDPGYFAIFIMQHWGMVRSLPRGRVQVGAAGQADAGRGHKNGGERGIRTLGAVISDTHDFQSCSFSQLGHLSAFQLVKQPVHCRTLEDSPLSCIHSSEMNGGEGGIRTHDPG